MFDKYMLLTRGFKNISQSGAIIGFQMLVRITYYRGVFLPLITGFDLTVDGEKFDQSQMRFTVAGRQFTFDEMKTADDVHWDFGVPATLTVLKPGGLRQGIHDAELIERVKPSYVQGFVGKTKRKITLVV